MPDVDQDYLKTLLGPISNEGVAFAFLFGCIFIILNLRSRFTVIAGQPFPVELAAFTLDDLTAKSRFGRGLITYFLIIIVIYYLSIRVGHQIFSASFGIDIDPQAFPLYIALVIAGLIPNVPKVATVEEWVRAVAQRLSGVPSDHKFIYDKLSRSDIRDSALSQFYQKDTIHPNITKALSVLEGTSEDWEKSRYIIFYLSSAAARNDKVDHITIRVRDLFSKFLHSEKLRLLDIEKELIYLEGQLSLTQTNQIEWEKKKSELQNDVLDVFRSLSYMLSSAIVAVTSAKRRDVDAVLNDMGFEVKGVSRNDPTDRLLESSIYAGLVVFVIALSATFLNLSGVYVDPMLPKSIVECLTIPLTFFIPTYYGLKFYMFRRNKIQKVAASNWYVDEQKHRVKMSKRLYAIINSIVVMAVVAPFLDFVILLANTQQVNDWSKAFPIFSAFYWTSLIPYFVVPVYVVVAYSYYLETDTKAEKDSVFARSHFSTWSRIRVSGGFGVLAGTLNFIVHFIIKTQNSPEETVPALQSLDAILFSPLFGSLVLDFVIAATGVFVFFWTFHASGRIEGGKPFGPEVGEFAPQSERL